MPSLRGQTARIAAIAALACALVALDYRDGPLTQTPSLYIFPIGLAAWFLGEAWGIAPIAPRASIPITSTPKRRPLRIPPAARPAVSRPKTIEIPPIPA